MATFRMPLMTLERLALKSIFSSWRTSSAERSSSSEVTKSPKAMIYTTMAVGMAAIHVAALGQPMAKGDNWFQMLPNSGILMRGHN